MNERRPVERRKEVVLVTGSSGLIGPARWRTMPWTVTFSGILVVPLGVVSITLVILQP